MNRSRYLDPQNWHGMQYGLAIEYLPKGDDEHLQLALQTLWRAPGLSGPWLDKEDYGEPPVQPKISDPRLYGILELPDNSTLGCQSYFYNSEHDIGDWLILSIPTAMFLQVVPYYERGNEYHPWLRRVDTKLVDIAEIVHSRAPFHFAEVSMELFGNCGQTEITDEIIKQQLGHANYLLAPDLFQRLDLDYKPIALSSGMFWVVREDRQG